jgi:hypothetical protein
LRQPNTGRRKTRDYTTITVSASAAARVYAKRTGKELIHWFIDGRGNVNTWKEKTNLIPSVVISDAASFSALADVKPERTNAIVPFTSMASIMAEGSANPLGRQAAN